jgi:hypothetical protein
MASGWAFCYRRTLTNTAISHISRPDIDAFFNDMTNSRITRMLSSFVFSAVAYLPNIHQIDVIYQGKRGDEAVKYAKQRGTERGMVVCGVLYDATQNSSTGAGSSGSSINITTDEEVYLSPSQYMWRTDYIRRLTKKWQLNNKKVGVMDDMGRAYIAHPTLL